MAVTDAHSETTYRRLHGGLWLLAGLLLGVLTAAGRPVVAALAFGIGAVAAIGVRWGYGGPLFDERDRDLHNEAAGRTLSVLGIASAVVFPTLTALYGLGYFEWTAVSSTIAFGVAVLYGVYGLAAFVVYAQHA